MSQSATNTDNVVADGTRKSDANQRVEPNAIKPVPFYPLEPAMFLVFFAFSISGTVQQSQIIYQSCTAHFGYNVSDCMQLGKPNASLDTETIELIVQPYAAEIIMAQQCIQAIVPVAMSLFIGPWSDKYGRKPVIISAICGYFLSNFAIAVIAYISTHTLVSPWLYVLAYVPQSFLGGNCAFFTGMFCYVSDTSRLKNRAMRMAIMQAALYLGLLVGLMSSSYILQMTSVVSMFALSTVSMFVALIYVVCLVTESIQRLEPESGFKKISALFDVKLVVNMFVTCFKRRDNWDRAIVWICMLSLGAIVFIMEGSATVFYLYVREKFDWTIKQYTFYDAAGIIVQIFGNIFGLYMLRKILGISEGFLSILSFLCAMCDCLTKALATQQWYLYVGIGYSLLRNIASPLIRAILANTVPVSDIGAFYSLTASIESVTPLTAAPLYSFVYGKTLNTYSGAFNFIGVGLFAGCSIGFLFVYALQKRHRQTNYDTIENNE